MDRKRLGEKLKALRTLKFPDRNEFMKVSKFEYQGVEKVENGERFLRVDRLDKWVTICGTTLSRFFADLEADKRPENEIRIVPGCEEFYRLLTEIIETEKKFFIDGIHANLLAMAQAAKDPKVKKGRDDARRKPGG